MSDSKEKLSGNYFYVFESAQSAVIYGGRTQKVIPCNVERYNYNDDFIIALQKATDECFFPNEVKQEEDRRYYWIIDVEKDSLYMLPSKEEYDLKRKELKVPDELLMK